MVRLALLESSFKNERVLEHRGVEFERSVIDELVDFFSGQDLFLALSMSLYKSCVFFMVNV